MYGLFYCLSVCYAVVTECSRSQSVSKPSPSGCFVLSRKDRSSLHERQSGGDLKAKKRCACPVQPTRFKGKIDAQTNAWLLTCPKPSPRRAAPGLV